MLKKFEVKNYRNFRNSLSIDFQKVGGYQFNLDCITNGMLGKMLIYGRNATGKTNLGRAILDIRKILMDPSFIFEEDITHADSSTDCAFFSYTFQFDNDIVVYEYAKHSSNKLSKEKLDINEEEIFSCDYEADRYFISNLKEIQAETINLDRYFNAVDELHEVQEEMNLPFLRWIINNTAMQPESILWKLADFISGMSAIGTGLGFGVSNTLGRSRRAREMFIGILEDPDQLNDFENFLNMMGVKCKLKVQRTPDGKPDLYFDYKKPLPFFEYASSGTLSVVQMYRAFQSKRKPTFLYVDEFDAFFHFEMSDSMLRFFKKYYQLSQVIITTHNTNLMTNRLMRPDCLFILSTAGNLTPLNEATTRELREGHNLEKMYISGEFERYE